MTTNRRYSEDEIQRFLEDDELRDPHYQVVDALCQLRVERDGWKHDAEHWQAEAEKTWTERDKARATVRVLETAIRDAVELLEAGYDDAARSKLAATEPKEARP